MPPWCLLLGTSESSGLFWRLQSYDAKKTRPCVPCAPFPPQRMHTRRLKQVALSKAASFMAYYDTRHTVL